MALKGAFFGESMFSYERDASKIALVHLVARLRYGGFRLLDTQFVTDHLRQFGTIEVDRDAFQIRLDHALQIQADFNALGTRPRCGRCGASGWAGEACSRRDSRACAVMGTWG